MPSKIRARKHRLADIVAIRSALEVAGLHAIEIDANGDGVVLDTALADALGVLPLINYQNLADRLPDPAPLNDK